MFRVKVWGKSRVMVDYEVAPHRYAVLLKVPREVWISVGRRHMGTFRRRLRGTGDQWVVSALVASGWRIDGRHLIPRPDHVRVETRIPAQYKPPTTFPMIERRVVRSLDIMNPPPEGSVPAPSDRLLSQRSSPEEWDKYWKGADIGNREATLLQRKWRNVLGFIGLALLAFCFIAEGVMIVIDLFN